jgi:hypothetical protein
VWKQLHLKMKESGTLGLKNFIM